MARTECGLRVRGKPEENSITDAERRKNVSGSCGVQCLSEPDKENQGDQ